MAYDMINAQLYLEMVDKSRDAAAYMLSRFLTRPDVKVAALSEFIGWSLTKLKQADSEFEALRPVLI